MRDGFSVETVLRATFRSFFRNVLGFMGIGVAIMIPISLIVISIESASTASSEAVLPGILRQLVFLIASHLIAGTLTYGVFQHMRGHPVDVGRCFSIAVQRFWSIVGVSILTGIITGLGVVMLIIPGIILYCTFWVAVPVAVVENEGVLGSLSRSMELTKGRRLAILGISVILWIITTVVTMAYAVVAWRVYTGLEQGASVIVGAILTGCVLALGLGLAAVAMATGYCLLRQEKEGTSLDEWVSAFE